MNKNQLEPEGLARLLSEYGLAPNESIMQIHGGGHSQVYRIAVAGRGYALRVLHPTIGRAGILYAHMVTDHLSRTIPEVPIALLTKGGLPYAEAGVQLATLSPWLSGNMPQTHVPWLLEASSELLARLHKAALNSPVQYPRSDRPACHELNWQKNHLFDMAVVQRILFDDPAPLYSTSKNCDRSFVEAILQHKIFIIQQHEFWSDCICKLKSSGRILHRAPIHGDIYASNLLCDDEQITAVIDWDECQYEPLVYELGRVLWEFAKDSVSHGLDERKMNRFLSAYFKAGGPVSDDEIDLIIPYICMIRILEVLLYINNSTTGDFWDPRYTVENLLALKNLNIYR